MTEPQFNSYPLQFVRSLLDLYDSSATECDGMTRLCATALDNHSVTFTAYQGKCLVHHPDDSYQAVDHHFWITLTADHSQDEWTVDYRLQCVVHPAKVGHGIFQSSAFPNVSYIPDCQIELKALPPLMVRELQLGWQHLYQNLIKD